MVDDGSDGSGTILADHGGGTDDTPPKHLGQGSEEAVRSHVSGFPNGAIDDCHVFYFERYRTIIVIKSSVLLASHHKFLP